MNRSSISDQNGVTGTGFAFSPETTKNIRQEIQNNGFQGARHLATKDSDS